jgi:hypothetical protein
MDNDLILAPSCNGAPSTWTWDGNCRWDAPEYMTTKRPLLPAMSQFNNALLTVFFRDTLQVKDVDWLDLICELGARKRTDRPDLTVIQDIYLRLQRMSADLSSEDLQAFQ